MHDLGDVMVGRPDTGNVGTGGDGRDLRFAMPVFMQQPLQIIKIHQAFGIGANHFDVGKGFQPGGLIGMMLHVAAEYDGTFRLRQAYFGAVFFMYFKPENALECVGHPGHPRIRRDQDITVESPQVLLDDLLGPVIGHGHDLTRYRRFGMCISHERTDLSGQLLFYGSVKPAAGRPIGIDNRLFTVRRMEGLIVPDHITAKGLEVLFQTPGLSLG